MSAINLMGMVLLQAICVNPTYQMSTGLNAKLFLLYKLLVFFCFYLENDDKYQWETHMYFIIVYVLR